MTKPRRQYGHIMRMVEAEYGQPFWDVVAGYLADGESIHSTSLILGYSTGSGLQDLIKRHGMTDKLPIRKGKSNAWLHANKHRVISEEGKAVLRKNMTKVNKARNEEYSFKYQGHIDTLKGHAARLGLKYSTVWMRCKRGMTREQALYVGSYVYGRRINE